MRSFSHVVLLVILLDICKLTCGAFLQHMPLAENLCASSSKRLIKDNSHGVDHKSNSICLRMSWFNDLVTSNSKKQTKSENLIQILDVIGSGSYGVVHVAKFGEGNNNDSDTPLLIAKRAWTIDELRGKPTKSHEEQQDVDAKALKARAERCKYYLDVEQHCCGKMSSSSNDGIKVPKFLGKFKDNNPGHEWLLFEMVTRSEEDKRPARSLKAVMDLDWIDQHNENEENHHLFLIQKELGMDDSATFHETLDIILKGLLVSIAGVHDLNIVHRDIKPDNILIDGANQVRDLPYFQSYCHNYLSIFLMR